MTNHHRLASCLIAGLLLCAGQAWARDIYVSTTGNDANAGDSASRALKTIAAASNKAVAGDVIQIMPGRYHEPIRPVRSGLAGKPITYRSQGTAHAVLTHGSVRGLLSAIDIAGFSHVVVDGIDVDGVAPRPNARVDHFATVRGAKQVEIRNGRFRFAHGWHGIAVEGGSSFVKVENNDIDWVGVYDNGASDNTDAGDAISIGKAGAATNVLVRGNKARHAGHNLLGVWGSSCVIEDNDFDNSWRDVRGGNAGGRIASIMGSYNVFQQNFVTGAGASSDSPTNVLIKVEGANNIARHNVLSNGNGEGISSSARVDQPNATQLRIYSNTLHRLGGAAWRLESFSSATTLGDNVFANNLVVDSRLSPLNANNNTDLLFKVALANAGPTARSTVLGNLISSSQSLPPSAMLLGFDGLLELTVAQTRYPQLFNGNRAARTLFIKPDPVAFADFSLAAGSPAIDQGGFLTSVVGTGRASEIRVRDSRFFSNGRGLVPGDLIQLEGSTQRARVIGVDHATGTLRLDASLDFADGRGVSLAYERAAPDIGAREFGLAAKLSPPTNVRAD